MNIVTENKLLKTKVEKLAIQKTILRDVLSSIKNNTNDKNVIKSANLALSQTEEL